MSDYSMWGIPGVIHTPQSNNPYAPMDARALADAYIHNTQVQREAQYADVPQNYSYEGGAYAPPNQVMKPSINDQIAGAIAYIQEPYTPSNYNDPQQRRYEGTPRYQQWIDQFNMSPREAALGSASTYSADIRANGVFYR